MSDDAGPEVGAPGEPWVIDQGPVGGETDVVRFRGSPWEFPEVAAAAFVAVIIVLAVTGVIGGIVLGLAGTGPQPVGEDILYATDWADVFLLLPLLAGAGFLWWQIQGWSEVADGWIEEDADPSDTEELVDALAHLTRARWLATWTGVMAVVMSVAPIARIIGVGLINSESPGTGGDQLDASFISAGGGVLAALLLAAVVLYAVMQLRRMCTARLAVDDEGDGEEDLEDQELL